MSKNKGLASFLFLSVGGRQVIPDRCGVVALSKSGDIIYSMGTLLEPVKAVVAINALPLVTASTLNYKGKVFREAMQFDVSGLKTNEQGAYAMHLSPLFQDTPATIPVEEADSDTHFLVVAGEKDAFGFRECLEPFRNRMLRHNKHNFETVLYPGAGHILESPYGPLIKHSFQRHIPDWVTPWGG